MCGPIFLSASNAESTILSEAGIGFKTGQSGDLVVDRCEIPLGRVERAGATSGSALIKGPNASLGLDEQSFAAGSLHRRTTNRRGYSAPTCGEATTSGELTATDWRRSHHLPQKYNHRFH
jgi:hypothetical protein